MQVELEYSEMNVVVEAYKKGLGDGEGLRDQAVRDIRGQVSSLLYRLEHLVKSASNCALEALPSADPQEELQGKWEAWVGEERAKYLRQLGDIRSTATAVLDSARKITKDDGVPF